MPNPLRKLMPEIYYHEGVWEGTYRHIDIDGTTLDFHKSRVECIFPDEGDVVYIQRNKFEWEDGRSYEVEFPGIIVEDKIFWDTDTFSGYGWQSGENIFLLELDRKDEVGACFREAIILGSHRKSRARTWHWFKDGVCFKRTLCDEHLVT